MRLRTALSAALLAAGAALVSAMPAAAVANGADVPDGKFEFAAKLTMTDIPKPDGSKYDSACSGALIAPQWIITAGHCFHDVDRNPISGPVPYPTSVLLGTTEQQDGAGETRKVTDVLQAETNDVALAKLDSPVTDITPLSVEKSAPTVGQEVTLAGWGSLTATDPAPSTKLQQGTMKVASLDDTTVAVQGVSPKNDTSACTYDSGAPYFTSDGEGGKLVSIESTGPDCPHTDAETTSRADVIADWITEHTA
ncbi:S1 family peptidase [Amycolatopsis jiangsuensis]|uniref:Secreted trypsin-like serine protease n=1 Tax=Amycolatopsis jiangsuensis TaxID=1181879 RepID=A0A840J172_9PSEU|nr:trypsin-like serine protease [Amycolatopsis jiangsuensis]MBB4687172.1 secreted trypsin-like serine protease [Amycolatopsis jiangsuensis]